MNRLELLLTAKESAKSRYTEIKTISECMGFCEKDNYRTTTLKTGGNDRLFFERCLIETLYEIQAFYRLSNKEAYKHIREEALGLFGSKTDYYLSLIIKQ